MTNCHWSFESNHFAGKRKPLSAGVFMLASGKIENSNCSGSGKETVAQPLARSLIARWACSIAESIEARPPASELATAIRPNRTVNAGHTCRKPASGARCARRTSCGDELDILRWAGGGIGRASVYPLRQQP